ncbi:hypothetical protein E2562_001448 [Oryza meyeriana var. granulata]|uniref:Uncharacterized protein n=1 Tax=Oryza meyeriana var. granulata TaxID=110450 RepID=A0A6G1DCY1_9ORYZ|nr:hypothetical protein E2562_001448 [Oryza meyeriana var. granulata]
MEILLHRGHLDASVFAGGAAGSPSKDSNVIRTACLRFGRERPELIRHISRWDIQVALRCGCPGIDRKVVNSGKRLRAHVGLDEGEKGTSCSMRTKSIFLSKRVTGYAKDGIQSRRQILQNKAPFSDEDSDFWSSEVEGPYHSDDNMTPIQKDYKFLESFPIIGGRTAMSQDPLEREKWKEEMSRKNKGLLTKVSQESNRPSRPIHIPRSIELIESGDDDDISSWFSGGTSNINMKKA